PGRLGDPGMYLDTDPRTHPRLLDVLKAHGAGGPPPLIADITSDSPLDKIGSFTLKVEDLIEEHYRQLNYSVPGEVLSTSITRREESIPKPDGDRMRLIIHRPALPSVSPLPAVIYLHGGAMVMLSTDSPMHLTWAQSLARTGLVVIAVDFRNALTRTGLNPFPAGLDDCSAAVRWVAAHKEQLGVGRLVLQGESGGANLALATALRAKREGWLDEISGVCAAVPYISGAYDLPLEWQLRELPSLVECNGYIMTCANSSLNAKLYDPTGTNARNPLAWPYWATEEDVKGLPPHLIVTSELDILRDEGNAYYRKLVRAGVHAIGRMNLGVIHQGEICYRHSVPEIFLNTLWEIRTFIE
ncbi:Alpha/Beta hydrolase protein, partial [Lasiosphaeris hirsuta]